MTVAKNLFLMSAIAFNAGNYKQAGQMFAACLSSDDAKEFLATLADSDSPNKCGEDVDQDQASESASELLKSEQVGKRAKLHSISKKILIGMSESGVLETNPNNDIGKGIDSDNDEFDDDDSGIDSLTINRNDVDKNVAKQSLISNNSSAEQTNSPSEVRRNKIVSPIKLKS